MVSSPLYVKFTSSSFFLLILLFLSFFVASGSSQPQD
jgi:hypothetical protein